MFKNYSTGDLFEDWPIGSILIALVVAVVLFFVCDAFMSESIYFSGIVVDKHYKAETNTVGSAYVTTSNGKSGFATTTEHEDEEFLVMVRESSGRVMTVKCSPEVYYSKKQGYPIYCYWAKGKFTGIAWVLRGVQ